MELLYSDIKTTTNVDTIMTRQEAVEYLINLVETVILEGKLTNKYLDIIIDDIHNKRFDNNLRHKARVGKIKINDYDYNDPSEFETFKEILSLKPDEYTDEDYIIEMINSTYKSKEDFYKLIDSDFDVFYKKELIKRYFSDYNLYSYQNYELFLSGIIDMRTIIDNISLNKFNALYMYSSSDSLEKILEEISNISVGSRINYFSNIVPSATTRIMNHFLNDSIGTYQHLIYEVLDSEAKDELFLAMFLYQEEDNYTHMYDNVINKEEYIKYISENQSSDKWIGILEKMNDDDLEEYLENSKTYNFISSRSLSILINKNNGNYDRTNIIRDYFNNNLNLYNNTEEDLIRASF